MFALVNINFEDAPPYRTLAMGINGALPAPIMGVLIGDQMVTVIPSLQSFGMRILAAAPSRVAHKEISYGYTAYGFEHKTSEGEVYSRITVCTKDFPEHPNLINAVTFKDVRVGIDFDELKKEFSGEKEGITREE
jgi:hypothetical protein